MSSALVHCVNCDEQFLKEIRYINENKKFGHNFYCSLECQSLYKNKHLQFKCENKNCKNSFKRATGNISLHNFCSRSCAAQVNNSFSPKRFKIYKNCQCCGVEFTGRGMSFCSKQCSSIAHKTSKDEIIHKIQEFYNKNKRIPFKWEFSHYSVARKRFSTWNNAIKSAGFEPNPVMFAKRQIAKDGHICDSVAEMIIDDFLFRRGIIHERNIPYPEGSYTADFRIGDKFIEYFGLAGQLKRYDLLKTLKQDIAAKYKMKIIEIYPNDLFVDKNLAKLLL